MADIFVSYRRDDSQRSAGRINDRLEAVFGAGRVFFDTVTTKPGEDFHAVLGNRVGSCRVLLAVIGPRWLEILVSQLSETNDFVRIEIAEALQRKVRVIPVLIDGAKPPPAAQLPDDLKALACLNAVPVRAETSRPDLEQLIGFLRELLDGGTTPPPPAREGRIEVGAHIVHGALDGWFKPGAGKAEWFKDLDVGPEMVVVPAGSFTMGSTDYGSGKLPHKVAVGVPFAVGRFTVTRGQFAAFVNATGHKAEGAHVLKGDKREFDPKASWRNPGFAQNDNHPVVCVNWDDARAYADWLSGRTGKTYRLLSEAEWEYCCRARTTTKYAFGDSISTSQAQYSAKRTVEVGKFAPNAWGLYDMHGNVWEWCEDAWHEDYKGAPEDGTVWPGGDMSSRVLRGGSWYVIDPVILRSAYRIWFLPDDRNGYFGFRVARTL